MTNLFYCKSYIEPNSFWHYCSHDNFIQFLGTGLLYFSLFNHLFGAMTIFSGYSLSHAPHHEKDELAMI